MDQKNLTTLRNEAADREWLDYDFSDNVVEDTNGWQYTTPGTEMTRVIFLKNTENPDGDSVKANFTVVFKERGQRRSRGRLRINHFGVRFRSARRT